MRVIIISGIPGAGKTTVARMLAARFERAAHIEGDLVGHRFIVSGLVPPQGPPQDEADAQLELRRDNICLLADSFAATGFLPVIDDVVVASAVLDGYRRRLRTRPLLLVELVPRLDVVQARDRDRDKHVFSIWGHLDAQLQTSMPRLGLWIDTSDLTAGENGRRDRGAPRPSRDPRIGGHPRPRPSSGVFTWASRWTAIIPNGSSTPCCAR